MRDVKEETVRRRSKTPMKTVKKEKTPKRETRKSASVEKWVFFFVFLCSLIITDIHKRGSV